MMLEDLAWRYVALGETQVWLFSVGFLVLGGLVAVVFHRGTAILNRAPYFALSSFVIFGIACGQAIWLFGGQAMVNGWLSGLVGLEAMLSFVAGYALVALGQARSRDALGHGWAGIVSLVPLANLWLLFKPGEEPSRAGPAIGLLSGGFGVVTGLALIVMSRILTQAIVPVVESRVMAASEEPSLADRFITVGIRSSSLPVVLLQVAAGTTVPVEFENGLTLREVTAEGMILTFVYVVTEPGGELDHGAADLVRRDVCADRVMSRLMAEGARISFRYEGVNALGGETVLGEFSATARECQV